MGECHCDHSRCGKQTTPRLKNTPIFWISLRTCATVDEDDWSATIKTFVSLWLVSVAGMAGDSGNDN
jgi:hypothetical protein